MTPDIIRTFLLVAGIIDLVLLIIALIVIVNNKKMSTIGRVLRTVEAVVVPVIGPIAVLVEVLTWKMKEEKSESKKYARR